MPISSTVARDLLESIRRKAGAEGFPARLASRPPEVEPLPEAVPRDRDRRSARAERIALLASQGADLRVLTGGRVQVPDTGFAGNVENFVGVAQVPVGVIGPLRVNGLHARGDFYVPLATTEAALVASHARGAAVIGRSGGARAVSLAQRVTRAPLFRFTDLVAAGEFVAYVLDTLPALQARVGETTRHGRLEDVRVHWDGNLVYLLCDFSTADAAGQNMVTIATDALAAHLAAQAPARPSSWMVESNLSGDKKASVLAYQHVRGHRVIAEVEVPRALVRRDLHTTPEAMAACGRDALVAAAHAGTIGAQGQFANGLAALFLACGQDVACVAEAAVGTSRFEATGTGLYASVCLPNLIVGTVGGGTGTPTARECLGLLGCVGQGTAPRLAEIAAALVLAGELSINAALASGHFARAHAALRRRPQPSPGLGEENNGRWDVPPAASTP